MVSAGVPGVNLPSKDDARQVIALGIEVGQVPNIVGDHATKRHGHVSWLQILKVQVLRSHTPKTGSNSRSRQSNA